MYLRPSRHEVILDLGGGTGKWEELCAKKAAKYINVDCEQAGAYDGALKREKNRTNTFYIKGDATNIPIKPDSVDKILCTEVLEHIPEPSLVFTEASRVLKRGGRFVITAPNSEFASRYPFWILRKETHHALQHSWGHRYGIVPSELLKWAAETGFELYKEKRFHTPPLGTLWLELFYRFALDNKKYQQAFVMLLWPVVTCINALFLRKEGLWLGMAFKKCN